MAEGFVGLAFRGLSVEAVASATGFTSWPWRWLGIDDGAPAPPSDLNERPFFAHVGRMMHRRS